MITPRHILGSSTCIVGAIGLALFAQQSDFDLILACYAAIAIGMYTLYKSEAQLPWILGLGIVLRCLFFVELPLLSDDYHRFFWDGSLVLRGINPYTVLPQDLCCEKIPHLSEAFASMNSRDKFTLYPPISQGIFALFSTWGVEVFIAWYRLLFLGADILTFLGLRWLLTYFHKEPSWAIFFFINPAVITEGVGNLHIEILTVSLLVWAYIYYIRGQLTKGLLLYILSIGLRVLPLIFLPLLFWRSQAKPYRFLGLVSLITIGLFTPVWLPMTKSGYLNSLNLYFTNFEFNASIYYILRYIGTLISGYNLIAYIGPMMAVIVLGRTLLYSFKNKDVSIGLLPNIVSSILLFYLLMSTTVHPWYIILLLPFTILAGHRYGIVWSIMAVCSYSHYIDGGYAEQWIWLWVEYLFLALYLYKDLYKGSTPSLFPQYSK